PCCSLCCCCLFLLFSIRPPPPSPLFPYTTLFRSRDAHVVVECDRQLAPDVGSQVLDLRYESRANARLGPQQFLGELGEPCGASLDRKSTRLNSSHVKISYAVFCLKKKKIGTTRIV